MPTRPCPECQHTAPRYLPASSDGSVMNYYRCPECGHVFMVPKDKPDGPPQHVTPPKPKS
jgi:endogenous inhibitor of DNA gyrase (YacG/DUF329 family)